MEIKIESVTPQKAEAWLNANKNNRKMRDGVAEQYAEDMRNHRWTQCTAPIAFYEDGDLADGQHRLWAVIDSGTTQNFAVARGLNRQDGLNIDTGLTRSVVDNGRISGLDTQLSNELVAVARAVEVGDSASGRLSNAAKLDMVERHRDACTWALSHGPRARYVRNAIVLGAVARAYYMESDLKRLERFCCVVGAGFSEGDHESAAISLRNYLLNKGAISTHSTLWRDTFMKAQNAIAYFMKGKKLTVIKAVNDEPYPLKKRRSR